MISPTLLLSLLGCPYIFGGPDLSNVKKGGQAPVETGISTPTGATPTADTGTPIPTAVTGLLTPTAATGATARTGQTAHTGLTSPSGDTGTLPLGDPPVIEELSLGYRYDGIVILVTVSDVDADVEGGVVQVADGKSLTTFAIPDEVMSWDPKTGEVRVKYRPDDFCDGVDRAVRISVVDAVGNVSGDAPISIDIFGVGKLVETGTYTTPVGLIEVPAIFCGEATDDYDSDAVDFRIPSPGPYELTLGWELEADLDLWLYDEYYSINQSVSFDLTPPERIDENLAASITYQFEVSWYDGVTTDWSVLIEGP